MYALHDKWGIMIPNLDGKISSKILAPLFIFLGFGISIGYRLKDENCLTNAMFDGGSQCDPGFVFGWWGFFEC